jgi:hypothetical protein
VRPRLGPRRTRQLVEEHEPAVTLRQLTQRRADGAIVSGIVLNDPRTGDETFVEARALLVRRRQRALDGERTFLYLQCPRCRSRRRALFSSYVGRVHVVWCRTCLGLYYLSQAHTRSSERVCNALAAHERTLRAKPGPKGRRWRGVARRLTHARTLVDLAEYRADYRIITSVRDLVARTRNPQGSAKASASALAGPDGPADPPPRPMRWQEAERLARQTARERFPPAPPSAWKRSGRRAAPVAPAPPSPSRAPLPPPNDATEAPGLAAPSPAAFRPALRPRITSIPPMKYYTEA